MELRRALRKRMYLAGGKPVQNTEHVLMRVEFRKPIICEQLCVQIDMKNESHYPGPRAPMLFYCGGHEMRLVLFYTGL